RRARANCRTSRDTRRCRPVHRVEKAALVVIGSDVELIATVLPLSEAVAGEHEDASGADLRRDLEVRRLVTDHDGAREIQTKLVRGAKEEAGLRLAAVAEHAVRQGTLARVMRADVHAVEPSARALELCHELRVDGVQD